MADDKLYLFWALVTALFVFATVYSWFIAIIVRKPLPGEMAWVFAGLAFITGGNTLVRSGAMWVDPQTIILIVRAMYLVVAISSCVAVVMLGTQYNGDLAHRLPWKQQVRVLKDGLQSKGVCDEK